MLRMHAVGLRRHGAALWMLCGLGASASAWTADAATPTPAGDIRSAVEPNAQARMRDFDIPAQPLDAALKRYAILSDQPTLFANEMVAGRTSAAVHGRYSPEEALHRLLEGTGLLAERVDNGPDDAFILKEIVDASPHAAAAGALDFDYGGRVQARVYEALCADARTAAQNYRALLRFQIDASGQLQQARLLNSTGNAARDAALLETLRRVHIERAPPRDMAQPLTMIVLPALSGDASAGQRCPGEGVAASTSTSAGASKEARP